MPSTAFPLTLALAGTTAAALAVAVTAGPASTLAPARAAGTSWVWPVHPPQVLRGFDDVGRYEAGHRGVDLSADPGQEVVAVAAGSVTFAGPVAGRSVVVVLHADGLRTTYEPVVPAVAAGTAVAGGERIGGVAAEPVHCTTTCLHLGLRDGEVYLDPLPRLRADPPVLLPLGRP